MRHPLKRVHFLARRITAAERVLPDFLIIGAMKCGTTTLYDLILQHPAVRVAFVKENHFFGVYAKFRKGENFYRSYFPKAAEMQGRITGEGSTTMHHPHVPRRVRSMLPDAKLLVILRDPCERAYSHYQHSLRSGRESMSFLEAIAAEHGRVRPELAKMISDERYESSEIYTHSYLYRGEYASHLENWFRSYPKQQLHILTLEDLKADFSRVMEGVTDFLGIDRFTFKKQRSNSGKYESMSQKERERLQDHFKPHNRRLNELLGRDFGYAV